MRSWIIALSVSVSILAGFSGFAHAEEITILQMKDGRFYHPQSGTIAATREEILNKLGSALPVNTVSQEPVVTSSNLPRELLAVYRGQQELRAQISADGKAALYPMDPIGQDTPRNVTLAVWNEKTDTITLVRGIKHGTTLNLLTSAPADIDVARSNWINSDYVVDHPDYMVVAVRYPIYYEVKEGKTVIRYNVEEAVYTPYSSRLHRPAIVREGMNVIDGMVDNAFEEIRVNNAKSRAIEGKLISDVVDPDLIKSIAVIEHMSYSALKNNGQRAVEVVYVTAALNPGKAYNYAKSSAGALGMFQFMPATYSSMVRMRPDLGLKGDFDSGMKDHHNATKASIGYMDYILGNLPEAVQEGYAADPKIGEYLAASYNGGYGKVKTAIQIWDDQISGQLKPVEIKKRSRLHSETIDYVKKLRSALPVIRAMHAGTSS